MWDGNHLCIKMNGEVYNQLSLSVDMHLHETKHSHPHELQLFLSMLSNGLDQVINPTT